MLTGQMTEGQKQSILNYWTEIAKEDIELSDDFVAIGSELAILRLHQHYNHSQITSMGNHANGKDYYFCLNTGRSSYESIARELAFQLVITYLKLCEAKNREPKQEYNLSSLEMINKMVFDQSIAKDIHKEIQKIITID